METNRTAIPKVSPVALPELDAFLRPMASVFRRVSTRRTVERYLSGLLTDLDRKNCDTIADAVAGISDEQLQFLLTDAKWQAADLDKARVQQMIAGTPADGILLIDDTGLGKKGDCSVGVQRQYSGARGNVNNCQVVVTTEYTVDQPDTTQPLHWPVNARLYLPQAWTDDKERCARAHVPEDITFQTKLEIALDLLDQARAWGVPFKYVNADAAYGDSHDFLAALEGRNLLYVCRVESQFGVRLPAEVQKAASEPLPEYRGVGRRRTVLPLAPLHQVRALVATLEDAAWQTITWRQGTKGPMRKQFAALRVHHARGNPAFGRSRGSRQVSTSSECWLLIERPVPSEEGELKYYISNLPADTTLHRLAALAHARWPIEQFYEDAKGECGFEDYQGRSWHGLHRHLALSMLTYSYLVHERFAGSTETEGAFSPLCPGSKSARSAQARATDLAA